MGVVVNRFDIYVVSLDPTRGSEIKKTRPCIVISPDEINHNINTVIIAPMTSATKKYPTRVPIEFQGKKGQIVLDQIRTVDKKRLIKKIGRLKKNTYEKVLSILQEMFEL
ncbi:MAG: type II toxin-antitoxin system PemK/MazF family toxin [Nitrospirota bacterium]